VSLITRPSQIMATDMGGNPGSRERSQSALSSPIGFDPGRMEAWRPALIAFYRQESPWMSQKLENLQRGDPFTDYDIHAIKGLQAALKVAA
jgi:hypothetical protein